jgi:hypothetical protein
VVQDEAIDIAAYVGRTKELVAAERDEELTEARAYKARYSLKELALRGLAWIRLEVAEARTGLYGRYLVTFQPKGGTDSRGLPRTSISTRDIVQLTGKGGELGTGVVYRVQEGSVTVYFEEQPPMEVLHSGEPLALLKLANEVTYKRYGDALEDLRRFGDGGGAENCAANILGVLYSGQEPRRHLSPPAWEPVNPSLNEPQRRAVSMALAAMDVGIIHGTGKTSCNTTVTPL